MGNTKNQWFDDPKIEAIYRDCVVAELLQIIHRGKLRLITEMEEVNIFLAFEDQNQRLLH
ncbi:hypothetical protein C7459_11469 [Tumebacillus permanentifrigoris]|uniref:Uncharacterized protein n=1 Tax=Tumebacillus permanentifrigoris TaxID=378543 RepID=A0A316D5I3_9BACL|nr:hypothetical protein C7459_11469 [Tumebacillus permanentifrigoris]